MTAPKRIQRKRTKGWRMPEGAVYVGRPTKWGNPFLVERWRNRRWRLLDDRRYDQGRPSAYGTTGQPVSWWFDNARDARARAVELYSTAVLEYLGPMWLPPEVLAELTGKDLACWCPLDQPCHADVLLQLANQEVDDDR